MHLARKGRGLAARVRRLAGDVTAGLFPLRADSELRALAAELARSLRKRLDPPVDVRELAEALCAEMSQRRDGRPVELRFERFPDEIEVTGLWLQFQDFDLVIVEERAETLQQLVILGHELWHMKEGHREHHGAGAAVAAQALSGERGWEGAGAASAAWSYDSDGARTPSESSGPSRPAAPAGSSGPGRRGSPAASFGPARPGATAGSLGPDRPGVAAGSPGSGWQSVPVGSRGHDWQQIALTVAARNGSHEAAEAEAEEFGLHLASAFRSWVHRSGAEAPADQVGRAVQASLGYRDPRTDRR